MKEERPQAEREIKRFFDYDYIEPVDSSENDRHLDSQVEIILKQKIRQSLYIITIRNKN